MNPKFLSTLKYKFSKQEYMEVSNITFKFWYAQNPKEALLQICVNSSISGKDNVTIVILYLYP